MNIQLLTKIDEKAFWDLRLYALNEKIVAFGASYEEESNMSYETLTNRYQDYIQPVEEKFVLGAFSEKNELIGIVGFRREKRIRLRHKGSVWGVFVHPTYRGTGVGKALLTELINKAKQIQDLEQLTLAVVSSNRQAKKLYHSLGFEIYGCEKQALKVNNEYYDEDLMILFLSKQ